MYDIRLEGDTRAMLRRIRSFSEIDRRSINAALAQGVRESTLERFRQGKSPDGRRWKSSKRAILEGGKTLVKTAQLRNSIHARSDASGFAVGTNAKHAATHQFGEPGQTEGYCLPPVKTPDWSKPFDNWKILQISRLRPG